jgi:DeoR family fructose operon transcriptional repressor
MLPEQRRRHIVEVTHREGGADVPALARQFDVSDATIRRDLAYLEERGFVTRTHGGVVASHVSTAFEPLYAEKSRRHRQRKEDIAALASERVHEGEVVMLDSGSTTHALARALKARRQTLSVITCDLMIALELSDVPGFDVVIVGGSVRPRLYSVVGTLTEELLTSFHANHAFLGADAIDAEVGVTNANLAEVGVKRRLANASSDTVLLADHSKFGKVSLARVAGLDAFDAIITDAGLPDGDVARFAEAGARLIRAPAKARP